MKIMLSRKNYNRVMHAIDVADKVCEGLAMFFVLFMIIFGFPFVACLLG